MPGEEEATLVKQAIEPIETKEDKIKCIDFVYIRKQKRCITINAAEHYAIAFRR